MSGDIHIGDNIDQSGAASIGKIQYQGSSPDSQAALQKIAILAERLRSQLNATDRQVIDESVQIVRQVDGIEGDNRRRALADIIAIAKAAGVVGVPLLDAAIKLKGLLGL